MGHRMRAGSRGRLGVAAILLPAVLVTGCKPKPDEPDGVVTDDQVTVLTLNAAMGFHLKPGDPRGTDATAEDLADLADDILKQKADVANLQEMAWPAAQHLREHLADATGQKWELIWSYSLNATYWAGKSDNEPPAAGYDDTEAGNAQLIRIGAGITGATSLTGAKGQKLPTGNRSFAGTAITTSFGVVDVWVAHLATKKDASDARRAEDVAFLQRFTESRPTPAVVTGDFNEDVDSRAGSPKTVAALRSYMNSYGYQDVARDKGPTSNQKKESHRDQVLTPLRIDYLLTRGLDTRGTARFDSHQSDHSGLVTTIDRKAAPTPRPPSGSVPPPSSGAAARTVDAALERYEKVLKAIGKDDVETLCDIAGPAAKQAQNEGWGPCETTMPIMLQMYSPAQKRALLSAEIDRERITVDNAARVEVPAKAVRASETFTSSDLGDAVMEYINGAWYMTD